MQKYECSEHHQMPVKQTQVVQVNLKPSTMIYLAETVLLLDFKSQ